VNPAVATATGIAFPRLEREVGVRKANPEALQVRLVARQQGLDVARSGFGMPDVDEQGALGNG
jgi:hypothetical protein